MKRALHIWFVMTTLLAGCDDAAMTPEPPAAGPIAVDPAPARLRRLSHAQYLRAVEDLFGPDVVVAGPLEPDATLDGLVAVGAANVTISPRGVELYEGAAFAIAEQVVIDPAAARLPCAPLDVFDVDCTRRIVRTLGRRIWRRPLTRDEIARVVGITVRAQVVLEDPWEGLQFGIAALLQAPDFLFRVEIGEADDDGQRYSSGEMASRLAFFLWNTTPDDALLDAAAEGRLTDDAALRQVVVEMLADPRSRQGVRAFFADYLGLSALDHVIKDPQIFTRYSPDLGAMAREETLATIEALVFDDRADYRQLFTGRKTVVNRKLAALYGIEAPAATGFAPAELPAHSARVGLLGHASVLALHSHPVSSSATLRGLFIRETLLCGHIPPPPANVDTSLPEPDPTRPTLRERVAIHMTDPGCAGCHQAMDPIGLALENFDGIGRYRATENGATIDASGTLDGVEFDGPVGLAAAVANHPNLAHCLTERLFAYATGHPPTEGEAAEVRRIAEAFAADGFRVQQLLAAIALSPAFRRVGEEDAR